MPVPVPGSVPPDQAPAAAQAPPYELIELFFFAYRDFVGDPDRVLVEFGFGRAHHRVLHFVARQPGLTVADLLDILGITKQSLNRVLKELVEKGFVEPRTGRSDRRQRHLHPTEAGRDLAARMASLQGRRIRRALQALAAGDGADAIEAFLFAMIEPSERPKVRERLQRARLSP